MAFPYPCTMESLQIPEHSWPPNTARALLVTIWMLPVPGSASVIPKHVLTLNSRCISQGKAWIMLLPFISFLDPRQEGRGASPPCDCRDKPLHTLSFSSHRTLLKHLNCNGFSFLSVGHPICLGLHKILYRKS